MLIYSHKSQGFLTLAILWVVLYALSACSMVGPRSISMGRGDYNEAINRTDDEQMLLAIVKGCYGETFSLLALSGVAANLRFGAEAGAEVGIGPSSDYEGNLVPFSAGLAYEENPTITYVPVHGEKYMQKMMSPIPLNILVLMSRAATAPTSYLTLLTNRINNMRNPDFLKKPSDVPDTRFQRFVAISEELFQAGVIQFVEDPGKEDQFDILITGYAPAYTEKVHEYLALLEIPMPMEDSKDILLPVHFGVKGEGLGGIAISTRSTFDLIEIFRAAVEIPEKHVGTGGLARNYPPLGLAGRNIHIHASERRPNLAVLAVKHRGYWFYIDDTDMRTKLFFNFVRTMWLVGITAAEDQRAAPLLTIPVSR